VTSRPPAWSSAITTSVRARPAGRSTQTIGSPNCVAARATRSLTGVTITPHTRIDANEATAVASFTGSLSSFTSTMCLPAPVSPASMPAARTA